MIAKLRFKKSDFKIPYTPNGEPKHRTLLQLVMIYGDNVHIKHAKHTQKVIDWLNTVELVIPEELEAEVIQ